MAQSTRRVSYSGPLSSTAYHKDRHYHHHHHHHHHSYPHDQQRLFEFADKDETYNLVSPFDKLERLSQDDIRETAYEIFFTACRSAPGFGGRNAHSFHSNINQNETKSSNVVMSPTSRVKKALGLKMLRRSPSRRMTSCGSSGGPSSPIGGSPFHHSMSMLRPRRPMTSAEIMRQQMRVTEHNDNRLRKTITRILVGQALKRAETIILPLELLRHLKPSEFSDSHEYHMWQKRQLKVLELGLLVHPSVTVEKNNTFAMRLRDIIRVCESMPLDTSKNSDTMRTLCNSVVSLAWRGPNGTPADVCHWADGFPLNIHFYNSLLQAVFDIRDETLVLDEVDELLELIKKTWSILGITRSIHNVCFSWVLFEQYVATGQVDSDLLCASHVMLSEVANDAKKEKESFYLKLLTSVLSSMQSWGEKRLLNYHEFYPRGTIFQIENLLPLMLSVSKILGEDLMISNVVGEGREKGDITIVDSSGDRVDYYIRSSMKTAFDKVFEEVKAKYAELQIKGELSTILLNIAQETEDLALKERQNFSTILKKFHPEATEVAALMLHSCYGHLLRQYLSDVTSLTSETVEVLQRAGKLEKVLVQMVVEDSLEGDDNGKTVVRDMVPYEVDSVILNLLRKWIHESLNTGRECLQNAKETETWNPKSKSELYAQSASELVKLAKTTVEEFFEIPIGITEELVQDLADGLESLLQDYMMFVAACGSKQSYIPPLPALTRCNRDSKIIKLWKKAAPCGANSSELDQINGTNEGHNPRPSTSRGTQRLYIRLNTLHYLLVQIHSLEKLISQNPALVPSTRNNFTNSQRTQSTKSGSYFEIINSSLPAACQHVSEVAAYRLIFLDSSSVFYDSLYVDDVANARIRPALRILKQNLTLLTTLLVDRAQPLAMKEVMKASFDAFLMVLLAGGNSRVFNRSDHVMIQEDFESLNRVFCTCGEGLVSENVVEREAAVVEGVIGLMAQHTEQLMEDFSIATCETSGIGVMSMNGQKLPMPPTTGRWHRSDPNTILRVLCHRNDRAANYFLKRTFQLAKRR